MCRTVADVATLLGPLIGVDPRDEATKASAGRGEPDYRKYLDPAGLRGARIGVQRKFMGISAKTVALYEEAIQAVKRAGATVIDPVDFTDPAELGRIEWEVLCYEFKAGIADYLASLGSGVRHKSLADLIAFNEANKDREMPFFGQETFLRSVDLEPLTSPKYRTRLATCRRLARTEGLDRLLRLHRLDAIIAITAGPSWPIDLVNGDRTTGGSTTYAAVAGYPSITVPAGQVQGLPVGLSFMGPAWSEGKLIRLAYSFERTTAARKPPRFLETAG
jgi:amidase